MFAGRRGENNMRSRIAREGVRAGRGSGLPQQWPASLRAVRTFAANVRSMCRERARVNGDDLAVAVFRTNDGFSWVSRLVPGQPCLLGYSYLLAVSTIVASLRAPRRAREWTRVRRGLGIWRRSPPFEWTFFFGNVRRNTPWAKIRRNIRRYIVESRKRWTGKPLRMQFISTSWSSDFEQNRKNVKTVALFYFSSVCRSYIARQSIQSGGISNF